MLVNLITAFWLVLLARADQIECALYIPFSKLCAFRRRYHLPCCSVSSPSLELYFVLYTLSGRSLLSGACIEGLLHLFWLFHKRACSVMARNFLTDWSTLSTNIQVLQYEAMYYTNNIYSAPSISGFRLLPSLYRWAADSVFACWVVL